MVGVVTQKLTLEAVSDDLSCAEIIRRLKSVGIFASSLEVKPLNDRDEQRELDMVTQRLHDIMELIDRKNPPKEGRSEFKRDPERMTKEDLERAGTRTVL